MELIATLDNTFKFDDDTIRVLGDSSNPLFIASDICKILDITNVSQALSSIPEKWKGIILNKTSGGKQNMYYVTEPGLYKLITKSKKKIAEKFQEWLYEEVLPKIRKNGEYILEEYKQQIEKLENDLVKVKKSNIKQTERFGFYHNFRDMPSVYIISDPGKLNKSELKFGFTENINNRLEHDRCMIPNLRLEFLMYTPFPRLFEATIKHRFYEQLINKNHEWIIEPLENVIDFYRTINKVMNFKGIEEDSCWKYNNVLEDEEDDKKVYTKKDEEKIEPKEEIKEYKIGLKTELLSTRLKKILPGWLIKSEYIKINEKSPEQHRYCDGWCKKYIKTNEFSYNKKGNTLVICKKCEDMEDIARIKIETGVSKADQIKKNPLLLLCKGDTKVCRQCKKIKNLEDFEDVNRKCRECKRNNQKTRIATINFKDTIELLKTLKEKELETEIKKVSKDELIKIIKELKIGRLATDKKDDMNQKVFLYFN